MLQVRPVSPALLAFRTTFRSEGQRGGWPWPPQQRRSALSGRSLAVHVTCPSRRRCSFSSIRTTPAPTTGRSPVSVAKASLNPGASPLRRTRSVPRGACTTAPARRGSSPTWPKSASPWPRDVLTLSQLPGLSYPRARERPGDRPVGGQLPDLWSEVESGPVPLGRDGVPLV